MTIAKIRINDKQHICITHKKYKMRHEKREKKSYELFCFFG